MQEGWRRGRGFLWDLVEKGTPRPKRARAHLSGIVAMAEAPTHIRKATSKSKPTLPHSLTSQGIIPQGTHSCGRGPATAFLPAIVYKTEDRKSSPGLRLIFSSVQRTGASPPSLSQTLYIFSWTKSICDQLTYTLPVQEKGVCVTAAAGAVFSLFPFPFLSFVLGDFFKCLFSRQKRLSFREHFMVRGRVK